MQKSHLTLSVKSVRPPQTSTSRQSVWVLRILKCLAVDTNLSAPSGFSRGHRLVFVMLLSSAQDSQPRNAGDDSRLKREREGGREKKFFFYLPMNQLIFLPLKQFLFLLTNEIPFFQNI